MKVLLKTQWEILLWFIITSLKHLSFASEKQENKWQLKVQIHLSQFQHTTQGYQHKLHNNKYTEHQKKLITSSEWHSLKSTASKWFIFGHRLGKFILHKHISKCGFWANFVLTCEYKKKEVYFNQRGDKCDEIAKGQFSKITETACLSGWEFETDNSPYSVYVTRHWNLMNSYWMFWIGRLCGAVSAIF